MNKIKSVAQIKPLLHFARKELITELFLEGDIVPVSDGAFSNSRHAVGRCSYITIGAYSKLF